MTVTGYAAGTAATLAVLLSAVVVGVAGRRALAPRWTGATAALVSVVVGYSFLIVEGELLGTFGWFSRGPLVVTSVVVAVIAAALSRSRRPAQVPGAPAGHDDEPAAPDVVRQGWTRRIPSLAASVCGALIMAQALVAIRATARTGNLFIDSLEYHLTWAAHFATSHHTGDIIQIVPGLPPAYYPLNSELLHGFGIALFHHDSLSLLLTAADLAAMMLAAYCVGSAFNLGPVALIAVTPLLALIGTFDASAINDWMATWPFIAVLAILLHSRNDGDDATIGLPFVAGLAGGLAMGAKLSLLGPTLALLLGFVVLVGRGRRMTATLLIIVGGLLTSSYWYIRNAVAVGSPFPTEHVPGLPQVPMSEIDKYGYSVAHYLTNVDVLRHFYRPGLEYLLGRAWIAIILLAVIGIVVAAWKGPVTLRMTSVVAVVATLVYLITPTGAYGPADNPYLFKYNVRYALPALAIALLALAVSRIAQRWQAAVALVFTVVLLVTLTGPRKWALGHGTTFLAIAVALIAAALLRLRWVRNHLPLVVGLVLVAAVVVGYPVNKRYLRDRYHTSGSAAADLYRSLQGASGAKIGIVGGGAIYPFLGSDYDNVATYLGQTVADHAFVDYATCDAWREAVVRGGFDFVVVEPTPDAPAPPAFDWTAQDPAATELFSNDAGTVFAIGPGFGASPCPTAG
jgi:hypothetical protein